MKMIAYGLFTWDGSERRSQRYGEITLHEANCFGDKILTSSFDHEAADALEGKRVRLKAVVAETRKSGHAGDLFLRIEPTTPQLGEVIDLGVGVFSVGRFFDGHPTVLLEPKDNRTKFWFDPRLLYRLHEQNVFLYAEETSDDFHPAPNVPIYESNGAIANGDGSVQFAGPMVKKIAPSVERLGDGLFVLGPPPDHRGARLEILEYQDDE